MAAGKRSARSTGPESARASTLQRSSGPVREDQSRSASAIGAGGAAQVPGTVARVEESVTFCTAVSRKGASTRSPNAICRSGTGPGCFRAAWQFGLQFRRWDWPCAPDPSTPAGQVAAMACVARRAEIRLLSRAAQGQVSPSCAASKARKPAVEGPESPTRPPRRPFLPDHHPLLTDSVIHKIAPARGKPHLTRSVRGDSCPAGSALCRTLLR